MFHVLLMPIFFLLFSYLISSCQFSSGFLGFFVCLFVCFKMLKFPHLVRLVHQKQRIISPKKEESLLRLT